MKDLKHLYYFEKLLEDANNELVREAQAQGKKCVASACENVPEPLLNLPGAFSVRLRAPRTGSIEMATYYTTSFLCEYTRALLERAIEGGFNFTDCLIVPDGCSMLNRCAENMELLRTMPKDHFFHEYKEIPMKADDNGLALYKVQCQNHILNPLHEKFGIDISDAAIRRAVTQHNRVCELIRQIGEYRKEEYPRKFFDTNIFMLLSRYKLSLKYINLSYGLQFCLPNASALEHSGARPQRYRIETAKFPNPDTFPLSHRREPTLLQKEQYRQTQEQHR